MHRITRRPMALLFAILTFGAGTPWILAAPGAETIEGRWRLIEQSYAGGDSELVRDDTDLTLEFQRAGDAWNGSVWGAAGERSRRAWPALIAGGVDRAVQDAEVTGAFDARSIEARYRVSPSDGDDLLLEVVERYALDPRDGRLRGTVKIRFVTPEGERGGYTLRRTWERKR